MLYLNTNIRGYPLGLRIGKDTKKPLISVDGGFEKIEFKSIPYNLRGIEVSFHGLKNILNSYFI